MHGEEPRRYHEAAAQLAEMAAAPLALGPLALHAGFIRKWGGGMRHDIWYLVSYLPGSEARTAWLVPVALQDSIRGTLS